MSEAEEVYKLELEGKTLYLRRTKIDTGRRDFINRIIWGDQYTIEDDIPIGGLPCSQLFASDFVSCDDRDKTGHTLSYTKSTVWLIEAFKKYGEKIQ